MRDRAAGHRSSKGGAFSIDLVVLTARDGELVVLSRSSSAAGRARRELAWDRPQPRERLEDTARRIATQAIGGAVPWIEQVGAFGDGTDHPGDSALSVAFAAVSPPLLLQAPWQWTPVRSGASLPERHRRMLSVALAHVRDRVDRSPIAFRMLAPEFSLTDLQRTYETLLGRRLHKASFRRALLAAWLVEPSGHVRSDGRGRPAQLFRFAPRRQSGARRVVRFEVGRSAD